MGPGDDAKVLAASELFDKPAREDATARFLREPTHHLLIAYEGDLPVGFVSGTEISHPDQPTTMFLNELGVDEGYQRRGIGRALTTALIDVGLERGCHSVYVLTEHDNEAAIATYNRDGVAREDGFVMFTWSLDLSRLEPA